MFPFWALAASIAFRSKLVIVDCSVRAEAVDVNVKVWFSAAAVEGR